MVAHADTEAICLYLVVPRTVFAGMFAGNTPNQAAGGIARHLVGRNIGCEPMLVVQDASLYAVPFFPVCVAAFPAYVVANTRRGHQVAFVSGINKDFAFKGFSAEGFYRNDPAVFNLYAPFPVQPFVPEYLQAEFFNVVFKYLLGHMRFKNPHGIVETVHGGGSLSLVAVLGLFLPFPGFGPVVVLPNPVIEVARESTDHIFVSRVGITQPSGRKSAQMDIGRNDQNRFAHFFRLNGGDHRRGGAAIDDDIGFPRSVLAMARHAGDQAQAKTTY